jgi:hypothetical protein
MKKYFTTVMLLVILIVTTTFNTGQKPVIYNYKEGSVVLTIITPDTVWFESDTRGVYTDAYGTTTFLKAKKIFQESNYFFGFTGLGSFDYPGGRIDPPQTVRSIINQGGTFDQVFYSSCAALKTEVAKYVVSQTNQNIQQHLNRGWIVDFCMVSFVNGKPLYKSIGLSLRSTYKKLEVYISDTSMNKAPFEIFLSGHRNEIMKYIRSNKTYITSNSKDLKEKMVCLINLQASRDSMVGMPVDIFSIYKGGAKFEEDVSDCAYPDVFGPLNPNRKYLFLSVGILLLCITLILFVRNGKAKKRKALLQMKPAKKRNY